MTIDVIHIEVGEMVFCDDCGEDFTNAPDLGGILFGSKAICPRCSPRWEASAKKHGEESHIRARCPDNKSFAEWVLEDVR